MKYSFMDDLPKIDNSKKLRKCIANLSVACEGEIYTDKHNRVCKFCVPLQVTAIEGYVRYKEGNNE